MIVSCNQDSSFSINPVYTDPLCSGKGFFFGENGYPGIAFFIGHMMVLMIGQFPDLIRNLALTCAHLLNTHDIRIGIFDPIYKTLSVGCPNTIHII